MANSINASNTTAINQTVVGINVTSGVTLAASITDNTISNLTQFSTGTTSTVRGIVSASTATITIARNTISNISGFTANPSQATSGTCVQGIWLNANSINSVIEKNTIFSLHAKNTGAVSTIVSAIGTSNPSDLVVAFNKIYDLRNASTSTTTTAPSVAVGILIRAAQVNGLTIRNNMISLGTSETTNTMFAGIINSFSTGSGPILKFYHNTINIGGASSGAISSFCIYRGDFTAASAIASNIDARNNILNNTRTSTGGAIHYVYGNNYPNTTLSAMLTGWGTNATNYNAINSPTIGWWAATKTASAWKSSTSCDGNSIANIPVTFVDAANGDLHLNMGTTATALESGGTTIASVTTDYDGDSRPGPNGSINGGATAPDIGADEFDGVPGDLAPPLITVSPISSKNCTTADRTFSATISDFTGVPTIGTLQPRVYFKKQGSSTWYSEQGSLASGSGQNGTWNFTVTHATMGGVNVGEIIEYFVVAQDDTPTANLSSNPGGVDAIDVNTITSAPSKVLSYQVAFATISGTFQVGSTSPSPFNTLTNAIASFNNACAQTGAVLFELTDNNYSSAETFPLVIQKRTDASATNSLTIKPTSAVDVTISNSTGTNTIVCKNNFTTIDGSNNGSNTQNLSIFNVSGTSAGLVQFLSLGSNSPITDCSIKNTIINNGSQNSSAIIAYDSTGVAGYFNNIKIQNNTIQRAYMGLYAQAAQALGNGSGLLVSNNTLNSTGTNAIRLVGLYIQGIDGGIITNNNIGNFEAVNAETDRGIWLASGTANTLVQNNIISNLACSSTTTGFAPTGINVTPTTSSGNIIDGNTISGVSSISTGTPTGINLSSGTNNIIRNNKITNIKNTNTGGWGAAGINVAGSSTNIYNNFVSDVAAFGFDDTGVADNGNGIVISGGTTQSVYHNNVLMNTNQSATGRPSALLITGVTGTNAVNVQNNIFVNTQTQTGERYAIVSNVAKTVLGTIDNNAYFTNGTNLGFIGTNRPNLDSMRVGFGGNIASVIENPTFASSTDLHINMGTTPSRLESGGVNIPGFTTDLDNDSRPGPVGSLNGGGYKADIGADEFDGVPAPIVLNAKVFLNHAEPSSGLMDDYTRTLPNFPLSDPYSAAPFNTSLSFTHVNNPTVATVSPAVLATTGNNAIVDWVFVELRTGVPTTVAKTKAALVQRDGDIVDTDGVSPLSFLAPNDNYHVSIRHRHNYGFTTTNSTILSNNNPTTFDFSNNTVPLYGSSPVTSLTPTFWVMNSGDANFDGSIDAFDTIVWESENGLFDDYALNSDYNMDGSVDALDSIIWEINNGKFEEIP